MDNKLKKFLDENGSLEFILTECNRLDRKSINKEKWRFIFDYDKCSTLYRPDNSSYKQFYTDDNEILFKKRLDSDIDEIIRITSYKKGCIGGDLYHIFKNGDGEELYFISICQ